MEINMKIIEPRPKLPKILYKYRDIDNQDHFQMLQDQSIFLSSARRFNDPFDCKIPLEYLNLADDEKLQRDFARKIIMMHGTDDIKAKIDEHIENFINKGILNDKEHLRKMEADDLNKLDEDFGVFCLSALPDNLLLWSHYANCHKGICIGFNARKLNQTCSFSAVGPVTYFTEYPNMCVLRDNDDLFYNQLFNKSFDWFYEKEFRMIKIGSADIKIKFSTEIIEEIYIGCMTSVENELLVKQIKAEMYPNARLFKMQKSSKGYFLEREEI